MTEYIGCGYFSLETCKLLNPYEILGNKGMRPQLMTKQNT